MLKKNFNSSWLYANWYKRKNPQESFITKKSSDANFQPSSSHNDTKSFLSFLTINGASLFGSFKKHFHFVSLPFHSCRMQHYLISIFIHAFTCRSVPCPFSWLSFYVRKSVQHHIYFRCKSACDNRPSLKSSSHFQSAIINDCSSPGCWNHPVPFQCYQNFHYSRMFSIPSFHSHGMDRRKGFFISIITDAVIVIGCMNITALSS